MAEWEAAEEDEAVGLQAVARAIGAAHEKDVETTILLGGQNATGVRSPSPKDSADLQEEEWEETCDVAFLEDPLAVEVLEDATVLEVAEAAAVLAVTAVHHAEDAVDSAARPAEVLEAAAEEEVVAPCEEAPVVATEDRGHTNFRHISPASFHRIFETGQEIAITCT